MNIVTEHKNVMQQIEAMVRSEIDSVLRNAFFSVDKTLNKYVFESFIDP